MTMRTISIIFAAIFCSLVYAGDFCKNLDIKDSFQGPLVNSLQDIRTYQGYSGNKAIVGELRQKVYRFRFYQLKVNYKGCVDYQLLEKSVILCPQTADWLYKQLPSSEVRYFKGSRPQLEKYVEELTKGLATDQQRALALMRFCRDLYKKNKHNSIADYIYGGTEEQLIEKGEILCETLARLHVALCEVAGMRGRIVLHHVGGHLASEIYIDGQWIYIDPRMGVYFLKPDGRIASVWELIENPSLIWQQSEKVMQEVVAYSTWYWRAWKCANFYFNSYEINTLGDYSLADFDSYGYCQISHSEAVEAGLMDIAGVSTPLMKEILGLTEDMSNISWERRCPDMLKVGLLDKIENLSWLMDKDDIFSKIDTAVLKKLERHNTFLLKTQNSISLVFNVAMHDINEKILNDYSDCRAYLEKMHNPLLSIGILVDPKRQDKSLLIEKFQPDFIILDCKTDFTNTTLERWVSARNLNGFKLYCYLMPNEKVPPQHHADYIKGCAMICLRSGVDGLVLRNSEKELLSFEDRIDFVDLICEDKVYIFNNENDEYFTVTLADDVSQCVKHKNASFTINFANKSFLHVNAINVNGQIIPFKIINDGLLVDSKYFSLGLNKIQFNLRDEAEDSQIEAFLQIRFF